MSYLLTVLPRPYDRPQVIQDAVISVSQGDTLEFLTVLQLMNETALSSTTDLLKITLTDGTQEGLVIWNGDWADVVLEDTSATPNVYRVTIPYGVSKTLREGGYAVSVSGKVGSRVETVGVGTIIITAASTSPVRKHPFTGWTQDEDFTQMFDMEEVVGDGVTAVWLTVPAGYVLQDLSTVVLSGFDPTPTYDIVNDITGICVLLSEGAAGTDMKITYKVVKTNVEAISI